MSHCFSGTSSAGEAAAWGGLEPTSKAKDPQQSHRLALSPTMRNETVEKMVLRKVECFLVCAGYLRVIDNWIERLFQVPIIGLCPWTICAWSIPWTGKLARFDTSSTFREGIPPLTDAALKASSSNQDLSSDPGGADGPGENHVRQKMGHEQKIR